MAALHIGVVGDFDPTIPAHQAIPKALELAAGQCDAAIDLHWLPTDAVNDGADLDRFDALWCAPGSPYRSMDGALRAIRHARERRVPFLGTCGGFQHLVIEYARDVLGWQDAEHGETSPYAARPVVTLLECALVEVEGALRFEPGSLLAAAYGAEQAQEGYRCRYGLNPKFLSALLAEGLRVNARDEHREVRGLELPGHPFFVGTLFQPERAALKGRTPPLAVALVRAALRT